MWLFSASGGTDVCTAFVAGCPLLAVYEGELQCRALGFAVEAWDERGNSLIDEVGELVITEPLPSMPLFLWGDTVPAHPHGPTQPSGDRRVGERLRESYFSMYPGVWRHGDWIGSPPRRSGHLRALGFDDQPPGRAHGHERDLPRGGRGRGGARRAGRGRSASARGATPARPRRELWMILFVVLADGVSLDEELTAQIKRRIREDCSPRHVPNEVLQIEQVPRTLSGKVLEVPVKKILMGAPPHEAASATRWSDPRSLDYFVELAAARGSPGAG